MFVEKFPTISNYLFCALFIFLAFNDALQKHIPYESSDCTLV